VGPGTNLVAVFERSDLFAEPRTHCGELLYRFPFAEYAPGPGFIRAAYETDLSSVQTRDYCKSESSALWQPNCESELTETDELTSRSFSNAVSNCLAIHSS